jgi:uncharacterized membrane-anchored protein YhcB (DUF1043 family)
MAQESFGVFETLTQYGALGVITLALGYALYYLLKRQIASEDKLKAELEELRKEMNAYLRNDNSTMKSTIENNTKAINDLKDMLYKRG